MHKLLLSFGLSLTILGVNSLPILAQTNDSYSRCRSNPNEYCLRRGDRGDIIRSLIGTMQCAGILNNSDIENNDGIFDEKIERAVRNFQREYGLRVDGIVGPQTYNSIQSHTVC